MSKFKVGDKVWIDKTPYPINMPKGIMGEIVEIIHSGCYGVINPYDKQNDFPWAFMEGQLKAIESEKPKATIINLPNAKIVINKPYVICTDGKYTGKAKCNPEDVWSVEKGIEVAVERYKIAKLPEPEKSIIGYFDRYVMGNWSKPKTVQERFPIGSEVEMFRKSGKPWTGFEIGQVATVEGYRESIQDYGMLVRCNGLTNDQVINPDDLRLIHG